MDNAFKWLWNTVDGWKTWVTLAVYFVYLVLCELVWNVEPDETFLLWIKGLFAGSLAHKVQKAAAT